MSDPELTPEHEAAVEEAEEHEQEQGPTYAPDIPVLLEEQELDFEEPA